MKYYNIVKQIFSGIFAVLFSVGMLSSCSTVQTRYSSEIQDEINIHKNGTVSIRSSLLPGTTVIGESRMDGNSVEITGIEFFGNWPNGWTDAKYEASGILEIQEKNGTASISIKDPLTLWEIEEGEIRYYDTYYRKDEGLHKVRQRIDRIREVCRFLEEEKQFDTISGSVKKDSNFGKPFIQLQGKFLFPEVYDRNNMGTGYFDKGQNWNEEYTKNNFPEEFHSIRNSGSMWRDFEEAPQIYLSLYNLKEYFSSYIDTINFKMEK